MTIRKGLGVLVGTEVMGIVEFQGSKVTGGRFLPRGKTYETPKALEDEVYSKAKEMYGKDAKVKEII